MLLSPRWISFLIAVLITFITVAFLHFIPGVTVPMLFVTGASAFISSFLLIFYIIDLLVFQEVNSIYLSLRKLKIKDFDIPRKSLIKSVNPLKKLNREISNYVSRKEEEIDTLRRMETFRREFIADVSHDLKTPIFAAQGFIHTLLDGAIEDPEVSHKFLTKAARSMDGLEMLVKDILILTQVESGDIRMQMEKVDLVEVIRDIFDQLEDKAGKREIALVLKPKAVKSVKVKADRVRITQVLTNLITNGITYGKNGGKVTVELTQENRHVMIRVTDNGIGIAPEHLPRIFERFYRVDKSRSRAVGGTGLGLAIVKHILNAHNTRIDVTSKPDHGTTFSFTLPQAAEDFSS
ncbi:sensor histidine kinase [Leadbetterella sp. DM7]|uniref:sensor histidine kinase n=1 Tax=Leadbetterella sp. DM7 TaxID=3235085 RepID=UPI00349E820F